MNNRIKQIAIDAWTEKSTENDLSSEEWMAQYIELFAKKILEECTSVIELASVDIDLYKEDVSGMRTAVNIIKEHFQDDSTEKN